MGSVRYKINTKSQLCFLYMDNKQVETKVFLNAVSFAIAPKKKLLQCKSAKTCIGSM